MTNFTNVANLNKAFSRPITNKEEADYSKLLNQLSLVNEEVEELIDAIENKDWEEVKDAIGDILVVTYGMAYVAGIDADKLMDNISDSNMSKFCNQEEMIETSNHYNHIGVEVYAHETVIDGVLKYAVKSRCDQTYTVAGVDKSIKEGKLLKNINWKEPDLNVEN